MLICAMTISEMSDKLKSIGLKKAYKPEWDFEAEVILLKARKPPLIADGDMDGRMFDVYDDRTIRMWTSQKSKAMRLARENGFKVRLLDGEAELYIPAEKADELLHELGAKVKAKRVLSPERIAKMRASLELHKKTKAAESPLHSPS